MIFPLNLAIMNSRETLIYGRRKLLELTAFSLPSRFYCIRFWVENLWVSDPDLSELLGPLFDASLGVWDVDLYRIDHLPLLVDHGRQVFEDRVHVNNVRLKLKSEKELPCSVALVRGKNVDDSNLTWWMDFSLSCNSCKFASSSNSIWVFDWPVIWPPEDAPVESSSMLIKFPPPDLPPGPASKPVTSICRFFMTSIQAQING